MNGQVRMLLGGTEAELRPLTAMGVLRCRAEASALTEELALEEDLTAFTLALDACLVAAGAYTEDGALFASGREALESLSADELILAGAEYTPDRPPEQAPVQQQTAARQTADVLPRESDSAPVQGSGQEIPVPRPSAAEETLAAEERKKAPSADETPYPRQAVTEASSDAPETLFRPGETQALPVFRRRQMAADAPDAGHVPSRGGTGVSDAVLTRTVPMEDGSVFYQYTVRERSADPMTEDVRQADMREVSAYFERDSRRYNGGFPRA